MLALVALAAQGVLPHVLEIVGLHVPMLVQMGARENQVHIVHLAQVRVVELVDRAALIVVRILVEDVVMYVLVA